MAHPNSRLTAPCMLDSGKTMEAPLAARESTSCLSRRSWCYNMSRVSCNVLGNRWNNLFNPNARLHGILSRMMHNACPPLHAGGRNLFFWVRQDLLLPRGHPDVQDDIQERKRNRMRRFARRLGLNTRNCIMSSVWICSVFSINRHVQSKA